MMTSTVLKCYHITKSMSTIFGNFNLNLLIISLSKRGSELYPILF
jgi:hypothetical protein